jgi:hypothetical protein
MRMIQMGLNQNPDAVDESDIVEIEPEPNEWK